MSVEQDSVLGFEEFDLNESVLKAIDEAGYKSPSAIQKQTIPPLLSGLDVLGQAETGSGKTAAFSLPILSNIDFKESDPQVLILTPTRELTIQVCDAVKKYGKYSSGLRVLPIYGGQSYDTQIRGLKRGVHIIVGTPGRVMDLIRKGSLKLSNIKTLVLDEADEMLNMGFLEDVQWIMEHTPKTRQTVLFSATMPPGIQRICNKHLKKPVEIKIKAKTATASTINQRFMMVRRRQKLDTLTRFLEVEDFDGVIIFARTKVMTVELAEVLSNAGFKCMALNGEMQQRTREKTIVKFKAGGFDIIIATDVAARGLDVERISLVINYDIPHNPLTYIHRIGRTGRAGRAGEAMTFVDTSEGRSLRMIEQATKQRITKAALPSNEDVQKKKAEKFKGKLTKALESKDKDYYKKIIMDYCKEHEVTEADVCGALANMLEGNRPAPMAENFRDDRFDTERRYDRSDRRNGDRKFGRKSPPRVKRDRASFKSDEDLERYSIKVGREHGVMPGNIVGAIANEISISSKEIGHIKIYDKYSTVDLPKDLPKQALKVLSNVWVAGQQLKIVRA